MDITRLLEKLEYKPFPLERIEEEVGLFGYNLLHNDIISAKTRLEDIRKYSKDLTGIVTANAVDGVMLSALGTLLFFIPEITDYLKTNMEMPRYLSTTLRIIGGLGFGYGLSKIFGNMIYYRNGHNHLKEAQSRLEKALSSPISADKIQ